jgi:hypothetical protein
MLSNKDFINLLSQPGSSSNEKVRFSSQQISTWDKQNEAKNKKKSQTINKVKDSEDVNVEKQKDADVLKYRDRALERRKDINSDKDGEIQNIISKLDAEQTKFLGGDEEHTHLVKGLDYVLLQKYRGVDVAQSARGKEAKAGKPTVNIEMEQNKDDIKKPIETSTMLASKIKSILFPSKKVTTEHESLNSKSNPRKFLARTAFEFEIDLTSQSEIPTMISRSKQVPTYFLCPLPNFNCL